MTAKLDCFVSSACIHEDKLFDLLDVCAQCFSIKAVFGCYKSLFTCINRMLIEWLPHDVGTDGTYEFKTKFRENKVFLLFLHHQIIK